MSRQEVLSPGGTTSRERARVFAGGGLIIGILVIYMALRATGTSSNQRDLLPYQALVHTLPERDQRMYFTIREGLLAAESDRARLAHWPEPSMLVDHDVAPFSDPGFRWNAFRQGVTINYVATPHDPAVPAWLLVIQEPEPNAPPDPAPLDDEHHRLPDGTLLHIYVWTHQYGGRIAPRFIPQPQADGWTGIFGRAPNPLVRPRT